MSIEQFDKLKNLVEQLLQISREAKFKIARLEQENEELRQQAGFSSEAVPMNSEDTGLRNLMDENERLKKKNLRVKKSLGEIVAKLETYTK